MERAFLIFKKIDIGLLFEERVVVNSVADLNLPSNSRCTGEDGRGKLEIEAGERVYIEEGFDRLSPRGK
jgi:hypothetical protein